jgi:hypothetical protein
MNIQEIVDQLNRVGLGCYYTDDLQTILGTIENAPNRTANTDPKFIIHKTLSGDWAVNIDFMQIGFIIKVDPNIDIIANALINFSEKLIHHTDQNYPLYHVYHDLLFNGFVPEIITSNHTQLSLLKKDSHALSEVYLPLSRFREYLDPNQKIDLIKQRKWIVRYQNNHRALSSHEFDTLQSAIKYICQQFQPAPYPRIWWLSF